ncbi:hypothetical protein IWX90DRAFT_31900 [Phyllosticta citrichinensis]|uniref:Uncharacterized protein n=1 Tax=Phyllosticta citrichinensis TaxID=1130410 RepID=A0ABR1Y7P2_9PEZI
MAGQDMAGQSRHKSQFRHTWVRNLNQTQGSSVCGRTTRRKHEWQQLLHWVVVVVLVGQTHFTRARAREGEEALQKQRPRAQRKVNKVFLLCVCVILKRAGAIGVVVCFSRSFVRASAAHFLCFLAAVTLIYPIMSITKPNQCLLSSLPPPLPHYATVAVVCKARPGQARPGPAGPMMVVLCPCELVQEPATTDGSRDRCRSRPAPRVAPRIPCRVFVCPPRVPER